MPAYEWIPLEELCKRSGMGASTLRRMAKARQISHRRAGAGKRGALSFNWTLVERELAALRETTSRTLAPAPEAAPTLFTILNELRDVRALVAQLVEAQQPKIEQPCKS
jgi:hypothetical protein